MNISREQLERFFKGECTAPEALAVSDYLKNHPEAADALLPEKEWTEAAGDAGKPEAFWQEVWLEVKPPQPAKVVHVWRKVAVAGVLTGMLAAGWYFLTRQDTTQSPAMAALKTISNTSATSMQLLLEDSSLVALQPGASIRYDPAFASGRRDIYLSGEAVFQTQGDAHKPFSVYGNGLAVTALGTRFRVTASQTEPATNVLLLEGKVLVKAADTALVKLDQDYILLPGDAFSYSQSLGVSLLRKQPERRETGNKPGADSDKEDVNSWYMFENQGLTQVFDQLSSIYNVRIYYNPKELEGMNFIGKIDQTDTLDNILRDITMLNNLKVIKNNKGFIIKAQ